MWIAPRDPETTDLAYCAMIYPRERSISETILQALKRLHH